MDNHRAAILATESAIRTLAGFIGRVQLGVINQTSRGEEGAYFQGKLIELAATVDAMPQTYQTDGQGMAAVAHLHYFVGACNFYITEKDQEAEQLQAFGLADLGYGGELGYISLEEIISCGAELDLYWRKKTLEEIRS